MSDKEKCCKVSVGGQALIEGIMMQGPKGAAMSVRLPDGTIDTEMMEVKHLKDRFKPAGWPLIRGIVNMVESLLFGFKCMEKSAEKAGIDDDTDPEKMSKLDKWISDHFGPKMMAVITGISMVLGFGIAFVLFFYLPTFLVDTADKYLFKDALKNIHPLFEGIMRMIIFVAYIWIVSKIPDIKRVFMYHGAEHKSIFCYEKGLELTVENVRKQKRFHPRCGTSFLLIVFFTSIVFSILISAIPVFANMISGNIASRMLYTAISILFIPIIAGLSYELQQYTGRHDNLFTKIVSAPGLSFQKITTKEPSDDQIEVAIAAIKASLTDDEGNFDPSAAYKK